MSTPITVASTVIRQHDGLFSLNDLHNASGGEKCHQPANFIRLDQTQALIAEINSSDMSNLEITTGRNGGTYACRELLIAYAAWISAAFHLKVIRVFLEAAAPTAREAAARQPMPEDPPPPTFIAALTREEAIKHRDLSESQRTDRHAVYCALSLCAGEMAEQFRTGGRGVPELFLRGIERNIEQQKFGILLAEDALSRVRQTIEYLERLEATEALGQIALNAGKIRLAIKH